jgi:hypothetical protein
VSGLQAAPGVLAQTFGYFRRCGQGRRECVVYWTGPLSQPGLVDLVVHPVHVATPFGYQVDSSWVTAFFVQLYEERRSARVQVHTHPGAAWHSNTDDRFALAPAPGFLSLVIPDYGTGPVTLDNAYLTEMNHAGEWAERSAAGALAA